MTKKKISAVVFGLGIVFALPIVLSHAASLTTVTTVTDQCDPRVELCPDGEKGGHD
jgi:hypothetical protein